jgi:uncharacterized protein (DUF934 family)
VNETIFPCPRSHAEQTPVPAIVKIETRFFHRRVRQSSPAEWLSVSIAPSDRDLEVCVLDYDGIVHALVFPCHKDGAEWADASDKKARRHSADAVAQRD